MSNKINVTQPFLPPLEEFQPYLEKIWESKNLTNGGQFHKEFEEKLAEHLGVSYLSLFTNGTIALITALQSLKIKGEVITTPYSFVATSHALLWNEIKPVFVDIDPETCNIDVKKIEAAITPRTTAILAVHCYGNPCDVDEIQKIADNYDLKVIYDAAHAFGVKCHCGSILNHGDLSIMSFHATKVFNTFEGGAIISKDLKSKTRIDQLKNFGIINETTVVATGINGKMSEFNAAIGLLQLSYIDGVIKDRAIKDEYYRNKLSSVKGVKLLNNIASVKNYAYFPIFISEEFPITRDKLFEKFQAKNINVRRYFYPLITEFQMYRDLNSAAKNNLENAFAVSRQILCLPLYSSLDISIMKEICNLILDQ